MKAKIVVLFFLILLTTVHAEKPYHVSSNVKGTKEENIQYVCQMEQAEAVSEQFTIPELVGDGIHDDTRAIQLLLDEGKSKVYLPSPPEHYLISRPLVIHSNQSLVLDRFTVIRLAPKSDCLMLTNDDHDRGNENIGVIGGIWYMDNVSQSPNPIEGLLNTPDAKAYDPERYLGICMRFVNVQNFTMRSLTFREPVTFCTQFARMRNFTIDDITFDYRQWNPTPRNMDGIHLDGGCRFGRITNLKGATNDDLVAINADDNAIESPFLGPIEDVTIDGIYAENCHSAVRLLSTGSPVRRIIIRNVFGTYYQYAVGFTKFFHNRDGIGQFDSIVLENLHCGKSDPTRYGKPHKLPLVWFERGTLSRRVTIRGFNRLEDEMDFASVRVELNARVESLLLSGCSVVNRTGKPVDFLENHGTIDALTIRDFFGRSSAGGNVIVNDGVISVVRVEGNDLSGMEPGI